MTRRSRVLVWLLAPTGALLALLALSALLAAPLARRLTTRALASIEGVHGTFLAVHFNPFTRTYSLERLMLIEDEARPGGTPLLTVGHFEVHVSGRELLRGKLAASAVIDNAKLAARLTKGGAVSVPDPGAWMSELPPMRLNDLALHDCELQLTDATVSPSAVIWVHGIEANVERLATRRGLAGGQGSTFKFRGTVQRSGKFSATGTLDALASSPTFETEARLTDLKLSEQYAIIAPRSGLQIPEGTVSFTGRFQAARGRMRGTMRPVFSSLEISPAGGNLLNAVEAEIANAKLGAIPERFESEHPATFDVPWTNPAALWDDLVNRAQAALLDALGSPVAAKAPPPPAPSPKGARSKRRAAPNR